MRRISLMALVLIASLATGQACMKDDPLEEETEVKDVDPNNSEDLIDNTTVDRTVTITYSSGSASVSDSGFGGSFVKISGAGVTVNYTGEEVVEYVLTGSTSNGFFKLYSEKKQVIHLADASITNTSGAPVNIQSGKRTFVVLEGSSTLTDGSSYNTSKNEDEKAALFGEGQLIFSGSGSLKVKASGKAAITSDDYLRFVSGTVEATTSAGHALRGKDAVVFSGGKITASTSANMKKAVSTDGLCQIDGGEISLSVTGEAAIESGESEVTGVACVKADVQFVMTDGDLTCVSTGKGGKGVSTDGTITISGGTIDIQVSGSNYGSSTSGGGMGMGPGFPGGGNQTSNSNSSSAKGMKADGDITITGGDISIVAKNHEALESKGNIEIKNGYVYAQSGDDAINSGKQFLQSGGYVYAYSTGNDGLDSNYGKTDAIVLTGGVTVAIGAKSPEEGIDAESNSFVTLKGGTLFTSGGNMMGSSAPSCSQPTIFIQGNIVYKGYFNVTDKSGNVIVSFYVPRDMSQNYTLLSCPSFKSGTTYYYGSASSSPTGATSFWKPYYYKGGSADVPSSSFTGTDGYTSKR